MIKRPAKTKALATVGVDLRPASSAGDVAGFACGEAPVVVRGSLICTVKTRNKMVATNSSTYTAKGGRQHPESFEGGATDTLLASLSGGSFEQATFAVNSTSTSEEPLEIKASA